MGGCARAAENLREKERKLLIEEMAGVVVDDAAGDENHADHIVAASSCY